jgi:hypothetical protein
MPPPAPPPDDVQDAKLLTLDLDELVDLSEHTRSEIALRETDLGILRGLKKRINRVLARRLLVEAPEGLHVQPDLLIRANRDGQGIDRIPVRPSVPLDAQLSNQGGEF